MNTIHIAASREYDVLIGHGLLDELGTLVAGVVDAKTAAIVSDDSVFALYGKRAAAALERAGLRVISFVFPHGESSKNLTVYGQVLNFLCENRVSRTDVVVALGGDARTCLGLAGVGDLIATCSSEHSRNRALGSFLVEGGTLAAFEEKMQMVAEGAVACKTVTELARLHDVEMPIAEAVRQVLWEGRDPHEIIETLFERPVKAEQE